MLEKLEVEMPKPDPGGGFRYKTLSFSGCEKTYFAYENSATALKE